MHKVGAVQLRVAADVALACNQSRALPPHVAVIGAAGGLGQGILSVCRAGGIRSDRAALTDAFSGAGAVLTALGVTSTSRDHSALLSANMATIEESMVAAGVDRIIMINTLLASSPGKRANLARMTFRAVAEPER